MRILTLATALLVGCTGPAPETDTDTAGTDTDSAGTDTGGPIVPGTETVSTSWDVDLWSMYESPKIQRFDTLGGRRKLDAMTIAVDHTAAMTVDLENASAFPLAATDYSAELYFQTIIQLGVEEDTGEGAESPPFFGPGAFLAVVAEDLAAYDGDPTGGDDQYTQTTSDNVAFAALYDPVETPTYLEALTGEGELQLVVGGFSEMWVYWNDDFGGEGLLNAAASAIRYSGTMTVTYEYSAAE